MFVTGPKAVQIGLPIQGPIQGQLLSISNSYKPPFFLTSNKLLMSNKQKNRCTSVNDTVAGHPADHGSRWIVHG